MDERLRWGGLNKADELLTAIESEMAGIEESLVEDSVSMVERQELETRLSDLKDRWADASEQRAVYADKTMQIQSLQDRIRVMQGEKDTPAYKLCPNGSCPKSDTFYRITRPEYHGGEFDDDDVIRFIERIEVRDNSVTVKFKAGISVEVER